MIRALTRDAAAALGMDGLAGTLTEGASAEAVVLDADPLADPAVLADPAHVVSVVRGADMSF
jgi:imidazolonepropionase-like amidohydrolase